MEYIIIGVLILLLIVQVCKTKDKKIGIDPKQTRQTNTEPIKEQEEAATKEGQPETKKDYSQSYQRKYLLTKNEYREYMKLRQYAAEKGLLICPKVRLLDIIEPRKGEKDYKSLFYKVQAKHVDFVICDQDLRIKGILELDDGSHDTPDRKERDKFVDQILSSVGYKVIHTRYISQDTLQELDEKPIVSQIEEM